MKKEEFFYNSSDKITKIHGIKWIPEGEIKCVLQISHGMLEHIDRYDEFAVSLATKGILVAGNDHLGHGTSLLKEEDRGYFSEENGNKAVIEDMRTLSNMLKEQYGNIPYFLLGHSMGSFLVRQYLTLYSPGIDGAIIVGTGQKPYVLVKAGMVISGVLAFFKGWRYRSRFVDNLALGGNNKSFKPERTKADWLSRDEKIVDDYLNDKRIDFMFTLNAYYNMFKGMAYLYDKNNLEKIPKDLPVILLSGEKDPVGSFGRDVVKLYDDFKKMGIKDVECKLYKDDRHEIINELDRELVYEDIVSWIRRHTEN